MLGEDEMSAKQPGLLQCAIRQLVAADPPRETQIVADQCARTGLPSHHLRLHQQRVQTFGSAVDGGGQDGRARSGDDQVVGHFRGPGAEPERRREFSVRRIHEDSPAVKHDHGESRAVLTRGLQQLPPGS
jgi:hypothetical protein